MTLQRKLVRAVEKDQEQLVLFNRHLIPLEDDAKDAPIEVRFGFDGKEAYLIGARVPEGEIVYVNECHDNGNEVRWSHAFFQETRFPIKLGQHGYTLHVLNAHPSAFIELVELVDEQNPDNVAALGLECCADIQEQEVA